MRAALAAACGTLAIFGLDDLGWRLAGHPPYLPLLWSIVPLVVAAAGMVALVLRRWFPSVRSVGLALTPATLLALGHLLDEEGVRPWAAALLALLPAFGVAALLGRVAAWRRGAWLLIAASLPLVVPTRGVSATTPAAPGPTPARRPLPNVILLVMDTTRRDHLSLYGYERDTTPALAALGRSAQVYEDAWSVAPWTPSSHASMLTGLLPAEHGVDGVEPPAFPAGPITLQSELHRNGYHTAGFVANPQLTAPGWDRDFETYRGPEYEGKDALIWLWNRWTVGSNDSWLARRSTQRTLSLARAWWRSTSGPRFLFVNLLDPHRPYDPPAEDAARYLPEADVQAARRVDEDPADYHLHPGVSAEDARLLRGLYDGEIAHMDREIGSFLEWLRAQGDLDHTILAVTADHGERLGERGFVGHDLVMDSFLLRVPLLVRYPPALPPQRIARRVHIDGLPGYLLHVVGLAAPPAMDRSALDRQSGDVTVAQYENPSWFVRNVQAKHPSFDARPYAGDWFSVADARFEYVCSPDNPTSPACRLEDLQEDPEWTRDASAAHPDVVQRLRRLGEALPAFRAPAPATGPDPALEERLRALGYVR